MRKITHNVKFFITVYNIIIDIMFYGLIFILCVYISRSSIVGYSFYDNDMIAIFTSISTITMIIITIMVMVIISITILLLLLLL